MSSVNKGKLFQDLLSAYTKAYSDKKSKQVIQESVVQIWNTIKKKSDLKNLIDGEITKLNQIKVKRQISLDSLWLKANNNKSTNANSSNTSTNANSSTASGSVDKENVENVLPVESSSEISKDEEVLTKKYSTPAQDKLKNELAILVADISSLNKRKRCDLMNDDMENELKSKQMRLEECQKLVKRKESEMLRHRKSRLTKKRNMEKVCEDIPELKAKLGIRSSIGKPRIEYDQPNLLSAIVELALHGSAAHERRRDDTIRTVRTLDELADKLREDFGFNLSRSATYLRLLPRKAHSIEGKRHVSTVPVKLIRPSNDSHRQHIDSKFAMTTINYIDELASVLGPNEVTYISQDDKAKIPIGLPAATKQAPLLMHMEYRYNCH